MTKTEFLNELRNRLTGEVSDAEVNKNLQYYSEYISDEMSAGKKEAEVIEELGGPVVIAKTILDTAAAKVDSRQGFQEYRRYDEDTASDGTGYSENTQEHIQFRQIPEWVLIVILILILLLIFTILRALLPILLPIVLICCVVSFFRRHF